MIVVGHSSTASAQRLFPSGSCKKCGNGPLLVSNVWRYFHLFWIPVFPYCQRLCFECKSCKAVYDGMSGRIPQTSRSSSSSFGEQSSAAIHSRATPLSAADHGTVPAIANEKRRAPIYLFSGAVLLFVLLGSVMAFGYLEKQKSEAILASPERGDLLVMKLAGRSEPGKPYLVAKVIMLDKLGAHVAPSTFHYASAAVARARKSLRLLHQANAFEDEEIIFPVQSLLDLFNDGSIDSAIRDDTSSDANY